ncbi:MAG: hypothetical protein ACFB5Z_09660, partial [Elainellaceae cyanobacterium]
NRPRAQTGIPPKIGPRASTGTCPRASTGPRATSCAGPSPTAPVRASGYAGYTKCPAHAAADQSGTG